MRRHGGVEQLARCLCSDDEDMRFQASIAELP